MSMTLRGLAEGFVLFDSVNYFSSAALTVTAVPEAMSMTGLEVMAVAAVGPPPLMDTRAYVAAVQARAPMEALVLVAAATVDATATLRLAHEMDICMS